MKECPTCRACFPDEIAFCPDDGAATTASIAGEPILDGRYHLEKRLGQGGMGIVYKGRHIFLKTQHAIKIILPDLVGNDPNLVTRFRQEALAAAAIRHQNIIAVTDFGVVRGTMPFLVMEFVQGKSLQDILADEGAIGPARAFELMQPICSGITAAHRQGIVHRDLKPLNVMVQNGMSIGEGTKILDFGLAKIKSGELLGSFIAAQTTGLMGSPFYMAPEQWSDEPPDTRADVYSIGVMLFQMLSGEVPFKANAIPAIMKKHLTEPVPSLSSRGIEVPPQIEAVVRHALEKEPDHRTPSAEDFIAEFRDAMEAASAVLKSTGEALKPDPYKTLTTPPPTQTQPPPTRTQPPARSSYVRPTSELIAAAISSSSLMDEQDKLRAAREELAREQEMKRQLAAEEADRKRREEARRAEEERQRQLKLAEEEKRKVEERRKEEERQRQLKLAEEEKRKAEEHRKEEERQRQLKLAEEEKRKVEAQRKEEERQRQLKLAEEEKRKAEAQRKEEERIRAEAEQARIAAAREEARRDEAARQDLVRHEEQQRREEDARREEVRRREEEQKRVEEMVAQRTKAIEEKLTQLTTSLPPSSTAASGRETTHLRPPTPHERPFGATTVTENSYPTLIPPQPAVPATRKKSVLPYVIAAVIVITLLGGGIGAWALWPTKPTPTPAAPEKPGPEKPKEPPSNPISFTPEFVSIPGGTFDMGRDGATVSEVPKHSVTVKPFVIDKTEVTNFEYQQFVEKTGHEAPSNWVSVPGSSDKKPIPGQELMPVTFVSIDDANAFAEWRSKRDGLKYRLPTEQEWEYAARGGDQDNVYSWGNQWAEDNALVGSAGAKMPKPVGTMAKDKTRWGVMDMIGNVYEWTSTKANYYSGSNQSVAADQQKWYVIRGASYETEQKPKPISATRRDWVSGNTRVSVLGFRLVRPM
jgi:serine/threonine protein kinase/formylglycine-generating enzyme required for sulfatase activity